ncbi:MAG TPA: sigma-70 family RNA polymerase sigma factor [Trebonia sp.]|jgi:RNA polymerase sigma-70 factor (ECF subfamily)
MENEPMGAPADEQRDLAEQFAGHRVRLRAVAYRMLGSLPEAEDAVQDTWIRLARSEAAEIGNLGGWLTTVLVRVCLNQLQSRSSRREVPVGARVPDPVISYGGEPSPEDEALLADAVGLALSVVLDTLGPAERVAFVLHDLFGFAFDEIAEITGRSPAAARQLASRARRRVTARATGPDAGLPAQRRVVDAFFAAARGGDFDGLVALLDPGVVLRADGGAANPRATVFVQGAEAVARRAVTFANPAAQVRPAVVNGAAGVLVTLDGRPFSLMAFTVAGGRIVEIDAISDAGRLRQLI